MSTYSSLWTHIIFATKGRQTTVAPEWRDDLHAYMAGTIRGLGATPIIVGGAADHVHLLMIVKPSVSISDLIRELKKSSSLWAASRFRDFSWQAGYAAFSVGRDERDVVRSYIARQEEHHRQVSAIDELRKLLEEHAVEYDSRYFQ